MTGSFDKNAGAAPDKVSENTQATDSVAAPMHQDVASVPPAKQLDIISDARGANAPVHPAIAGEPGKDAKVVSSSGDGATGKPEAAKQESSQVSASYEKHVESTMGNDTRGVVNKEVTTTTTFTGTEGKPDTTGQPTDNKNVVAAGSVADGKDQGSKDQQINTPEGQAAVLAAAQAGDKAAREKAVNAGLMKDDKDDPEGKKKDGKETGEDEESKAKKKAALDAGNEENKDGDKQDDAGKKTWDNFVKNIAERTSPEVAAVIAARDATQLEDTDKRRRA